MQKYCCIKLDKVINDVYISEMNMNVLLIDKKEKRNILFVMNIWINEA